MADQQSQTTAKQASEPKLCKMGCGFFGNGATDECCSKCWRELQKKQAGAEDPKPLVMQKESAPVPEPMEAVMEEPRPMEVDEIPICMPVVEEKKPAASAEAPKKKKKTSYKNMMAGMMQSTIPRDVEKEKESLRKVVGGGAFTKIEKI